MQTLWLVRHEHRLDFIEPEWLETAAYPYDPPLSPRGLTRAVALAQKFARVPIDIVYTSPFLRTIQTADPLAKLAQLAIRLEWGLSEWLCEEWTCGMPTINPVEDSIRDYPNIDATYQSLVRPCYPETLEALDARLSTIAYKLTHDNYHQLLAIAHKGSVLGIVATLTGEDSWRNYDLPCGGIIKLVEDRGRWHSSIIERDAMPEC
jgi:broad specificity phosphatase PhoE